MADLSQLSDEQLGVYRDLLAQKGGGSPPQEQTKPPSNPSLMDRVKGYFRSLPSLANVVPNGIRGGDQKMYQPNVDYSPLEQTILGGALIPTPAAPAVGAMKAGAMAGAKAAPLSSLGTKLGGIAGGAIGYELGHPGLGATAGGAIGSAAPKIVAAGRGAIQGLRGLRNPAAPPPTDFTMGSGELSIPGIGPRPAHYGTPAEPVVTPEIKHPTSTEGINIPTANAEKIVEQIPTKVREEVQNRPIKHKSAAKRGRELSGKGTMAEKEE